MPAIPGSEQRVTEMQNIEFVPLQPAFPDAVEKTVPVVFAANDAFAPACSVAIASVLKNAANDRQYDIVILESDISQASKARICEMTDGTENFSVRFFSAAPLIENYRLQANDHITVETFYRFLIQDVLPGYEKVLYLDGDLVCDRDVAELFDENIDGYLLAAVRDPDMLGCANLSKYRRAYLRQELEMEDPYGYFQAGVLLLNLSEMRKLYTMEQWLTFAMHPYKYSDQDVLNRYCQGRVKYLDPAWNVLTDFDDYRVPVIIAAAPEEIRAAYMKSREHPFIVHYAGYRKPWKYPDVDMRSYFWKYAAETPYYAQFSRDVEAQLQRDQSAAVLRKNKIKKVIDRLLPRGSAVRMWLRRVRGREEL